MVLVTEWPDIVSGRRNLIIIIKYDKTFVLDASCVDFRWI